MENRQAARALQQAMDRYYGPGKMKIHRLVEENFRPGYIRTTVDYEKYGVRGEKRIISHYKDPRMTQVIAQMTTV